MPREKPWDVAQFWTQGLAPVRHIKDQAFFSGAEGATPVFL